MEGLIADTLDAIISRADKEVLVNTVRLIQRQKLSGSKGGWKEFLNSYDRQLGASLSNPSKRSPDVLLAFLKTFSEPRDLMIIGRILRHHTDHKAIDDNFNHFQDEESPQQRLVRLTREHPLYTSHYYFPTHQKEWKVLPIGHISSATTTTKMVAIDCEMVLCEDGTDEVVKICIIDQEMKVKLEKLVKPSKTIVDYRTEITGVSAEDLVGITRSLVEVQESIRKLLKKGTILVGHSLHNDLRALKIEYKRVIDTAYVFKCSDLPAKRTPSLNNLCSIRSCSSW
ncbi:Small RNA degrading nuclease 3 [Apostasia shenzhenica]|uniref:Small RNA degrading nuclease 3 n=1 Tax=Apostasia shenzhenica TaxID=1088818 RepID=A0A2H9ZSM4_9ASPA|nr:Small RNA degrading nuclease 3 [Apostasia shenzhenica]